LVWQPDTDPGELDDQVQSQIEEQRNGNGADDTAAETSDTPQSTPETAETPTAAAVPEPEETPTAASVPEPTVPEEAPRPRPAPNSDSVAHAAPATDQPATLQAFFATLASSLAEDRRRDREKAREEGIDRPSPAEARENVKKALKELRVRQEPERKHKNLPFLAAAAAILVVVGIVAAMPSGQETLPDQLFGSWNTTAPRYANRTFELSSEEIAFQQGNPNEFARYPITGVTGDKDAGGTMVYIVSYENAGTQYQFSFVHQPAENSVRLKNQPTVVWYKK